MQNITRSIKNTPQRKGKQSIPNQDRKRKALPDRSNTSKIQEHRRIHNNRNSVKPKKTITWERTKTKNQKDKCQHYGYYM